MEKIVRLAVTPDEHRALKVLAAERDQSMQELLTAAVQASPLTRAVFGDGRGKTK